MMRLTAFLGALVLLVSTAGGAAAASHQVEVVNFAFGPTVAKVTVGDQLHWHNGSDRTHTATSNQSFFPGQTMPSGTSSAGITFSIAGGWGYHCDIHPQMRGKIKVMMTSSQYTGTPSTTFVIRAATQDAPSDKVYDVQKRKPGKSWAIWLVITTQTANFTPGVIGTWQFRSRLRRIGDGVATGWSPAMTIRSRQP